MLLKRFLTSVLIVCAFFVSLNAQSSYSEPKYQFQDVDTIDMYVGDTVYVKNLFDFSTGNPDGWFINYDVDFYEFEVEDDGCSFHLWSEADDLLEMETLHVDMHVVNVAGEQLTDTLLNIDRHYIIRLYPYPLADLIVRLTDETGNKNGYFLQSFLGTTNDTVINKSMDTYATHYVRVSLPTMSGDSTHWKMFINGEEVSVLEPYFYQFLDEDADEDGKEMMFNIKVVNQLPHRKEPFTMYCNVKCNVYPFPVVKLSHIVETYSGRPDGFIFYYKGGVKDCWSVTWTDLDTFEPMTTEQMEDLCYVTDTLECHDFYLTVKNGNKEAGYYKGAAVVNFYVWPAPSETLSVINTTSDAVFEEKDGVIDVECCEGDTLSFHPEVLGGYAANGEAWQCVIDDVTNYIDSNESEDFYHIASRADGVPTKDGYVNRTFRVTMKNVYTGSYYTSDTLWYEKSYTVNVREKLNSPTLDDIAVDFRLIDANQEREMTDGGYMAIRQLNKIRIEHDDFISSLDAFGGDYYRYSWDIYGMELLRSTTSWDILANVYVGAEKHIEPMTISMQIKKYDAAGNEIAASPVKEYTIKVYNAPHTPENIYVKGNGNSGTIIANSDVSDADLTYYDYYLVFGYQNSVTGGLVEHGRLVQNGAGQCRFDSDFSREEVLDVSNTFQVYSQWCYDDGVTITSGKRIGFGEDGNTDSSWDGSDYSGKGGTARLVRRNSGISEDLDEAPTVSGIYSADGKRHADYVKGMNILRMSDGTVRKENR